MATTIRGDTGIDKVQAELAGITQTTSEVNTAGQNWAGVAYTDSDAVGSNPTAKIYPDGTVVGSTDNGYYTKYPNGDLECRLTAALMTAAGLYRSYIWTLPVSFVDTEYSLTSYYMEGSTGIARGKNNSVNNLASASQCVLHFGVSVDNGNSYVTAISKGRWKS